MFNNIVSSGCSFMYGSELQDRESRYVSLIAKHYNSQLFDFSEESLGNELIAEYAITNTLNLLDKFESKDILVIVKWSYLFRLNYYLKKTKSFLICNHNIHNSYSKLNNGFERYINFNLRVNDIDLTDVLFYYKNISDLEYPIYTSAKAIHYTQCFLEAKNIKYIFLFSEEDSYNLLFSTEHYNKKLLDVHNLPQFNFLLDNISRKKFIKPSFLQYSKINEFKIGSGGHPLEEAHSSYADLIIKEIDKRFAV